MMHNASRTKIFEVEHVVALSTTNDVLDVDRRKNPAPPSMLRLESTSAFPRKSIIYVLDLDDGATKIHPVNAPSDRLSPEQP